MKFDVPKTYKGKVTIKDMIPEHLADYAIPYALVRHVWCKDGEWLSQEIKGRYFSIWVHHFFLNKDMCIHAFFDTLCMTLNYNLKGSLYADMGPVRVLLNESTYNFYCVPPDMEHPCYFKAGVYCCVHLDMQEELLRHIDFNPKCKSALENYFKDPANNGKQLDALSISPLIRITLNDIIQCKNGDKPDYDAFMAHKASCLQFQFNRQIGHTQNKQPEGYAEKQVERIAMYVDGHLSEPLKLKFLAQKATMSIPTLNRYFLNKLKVSLKSYILSSRMAEGQRLLRTTDLSITQIADLLAYTELGNFTRDYKKNFGYTPTEEREGLGDNGDVDEG